MGGDRAALFVDNLVEMMPAPAGRAGCRPGWLPDLGETVSCDGLRRPRVIPCRFAAALPGLRVKLRSGCVIRLIPVLPWGGALDQCKHDAGLIPAWAGGNAGMRRLVCPSQGLIPAFQG